MNVTCPHCWQSIEIEHLDVFNAGIELTVDCEVCCRPIRVTTRLDTVDSQPIVEVEAES